MIQNKIIPIMLCHVILEWIFLIEGITHTIELINRSSSAMTFIKKRNKHYKGEPDLMIKQYYTFWESYKIYLK